MVDELLVERHPEHAVLTLDRPARRNALSIALRNTLSEALGELAADEAVKVVVVTGTPPAFCAGFDLTEFEAARTDEAVSSELWASSDRYHRAVLEFPLPLVAAVNGPAIAGGFDLAVMCDLRLATTSARFAHPERAFVDVVYGPLHDLVGGAVARDLTIGGREVGAEEALSLHLVSEVVEPGQLTALVGRTLERICVASRDVLVRTKAKAMRRARHFDAAGSLDI